MSLIDLIRRQVDIVALISQSVPLLNRDSYFFGKSLFSESGTDLYVFPSTQTFVDFAQNKRGDIFAWVMLLYDLSFDDAVRVLATRIDLDIDSTIT